jgi:putative MATE family efflux protein
MRNNANNTDGNMNEDGYGNKNDGDTNVFTHDKDASHDMTQGPILAKLLSLAAPMMGTQLVQMLYNLTDMFWLGRLGHEQVASSGAVGMYMWLSVSAMMIGSIGAGIGVSQSFGRGDRVRAKAYAQTAISLSAVLGVLYGAVMIIFNKQMIGFYNFREQSVANDARIYLVIVSFAIPITYLTSTMSATFTASGNSRVPFICNFIGMSLNVVLDPLLIFTAGMGITGAAVATAIGQTVVCAALFSMMKRYKKRPFGAIAFFVIPKLDDVRQILRWAVPTAVEGFLFTFLAMVTTRRVAFFGADAMAISRVGSQIESLTWLLGGAFGSALITFIGQNYGANRWDRINETFRLATFALLGYGAVVTFIMAVPGRYIFALFLPDPALTERSISYLRILAIAQIPMCMEGASSNSFRGLGRTIPPAVVNTTCNIIRVPLAYLLSMTSLGLSGLWIGIMASQTVKGAWAYIWYAAAEQKRKNKAELEAQN